jgi:hypothetical protein
MLFDEFSPRGLQFMAGESVGDIVGTVTFALQEGRQEFFVLNAPLQPASQLRRIFVRIVSHSFFS